LGYKIKHGETGVTFSTYGDKRNADRIFVGKTQSENHKEDQGVDGRIMLKWFLK
jgi:hypothetical protein